ncbi:MAG: hypothetical protein AAGD09_10980 [Cyanobacteria bacterium P01_F01_bin.56]
MSILATFAQAVLQVPQFNREAFDVGEASPEVNRFQAARVPPVYTRKGDRSLLKKICIKQVSK